MGYDHTPAKRRRLPTWSMTTRVASFTFSRAVCTSCNMSRWSRRDGTKRIKLKCVLTQGSVSGDIIHATPRARCGRHTMIWPRYRFPGVGASLTHRGPDAALVAAFALGGLRGVSTLGGRRTPLGGAGSAMIDGGDHSAAASSSSRDTHATTFPAPPLPLACTAPSARARLRARSRQVKHTSRHQRKSAIATARMARAVAMATSPPPPPRNCRGTTCAPVDAWSPPPAPPPPPPPPPSSSPL